MKNHNWILFRLAHDTVHYMWNGEYPVLVTAEEDLGPGIIKGSYAWENVHFTASEAAWQKVLSSLEMTRHKFFHFNGYKYVVVARGKFTEP
jgi:hypothetical protein